MKSDILYYWPYIATFATILIGLIKISITMRSKRQWAHSITVHLIQFSLQVSLITLANVFFSQIIAEYHITYISQETLTTGCWIVVCLLALGKLFHLINRLTENTINSGNDKTSSKMVARILKCFLVILMVTLFGERLGIGFSSVLAFGGIGGIAIGIAGKDILSNLFSGVMLYFDRPFKIGDWISSPDRQIEGTVVEIGWRLTKIMTFDNRPLYVPNSVFSLISVENPSGMTNRRISTTLNLRYDDAKKLPSIVTSIRQMLKDDPDIDQTQDLLVYFNSFDTSSLDIMVYCFTKTTSWANWLEVQQKIYMKIIDIVHSHKADFAMSTQSVYITSMPSISKSDEEN